MKNGTPFGWRLLQSIRFVFLHSIAEKGPSLPAPGCVGFQSLAPLGNAGRGCDLRASGASGMQRGDREQKINNIYL